MDDRARAYLAEAMRSGRLTLFTGAGFSCDARALDGRPIPSGKELADELWQLCFPGEERDESALQDLFQHALATCPRQLDELLRRRLTTGDAPLPEHYQLWFSLPWRRVYTVNVDELEIAAAQRFPLPRRPQPISALTSAAEPGNDPTDGVLQVIHLNGMIRDAPEHVTFSTTQYATRLANREPWYRAVAEELLECPFLFVGTRLDEMPLWQHLEAEGSRRKRNGYDDRPHSFAVTPQLERARRSLLATFRIEWVPMEARAFAEDVLAQLPGATAGARGLQQSCR
jgi:hypothetical protein